MAASVVTATAPRLAAAQSQRVVRLAAWTSALIAGALLLVRGGRHDWPNGDTAVLVRGLPAISRCLSHQVYLRCDHSFGNVSKFPLLQQTPAYVLHEFGLSDRNVVDGLVWLNVIAAAGLVGATVCWSYRRAGTPLAVLSGVLLIPGMLVPYTAQSLGEPLATAAFGAVVLSALGRSRASWALAPAAALATISKETAAPFVLLLGFAAMGLSGAGLRVLQQSALRLTVGVGVGLVLNVAMNEFRYGTLLNHVYLDEPRAPHSMLLSNAFGMIISPNAGIIWFWPGVGIALAVLGWAVVRPPGQTKHARRIRLSAALALGAVVLTSASLADWWAPFGWYAWGPRLLMPTAGAVILLCLPVLEYYDLARRWLASPGVVLLAVIAGLILLPSVGVVYNRAAYTAQIVATWRDTPVCSPVVRHRNQEQSDLCQRRITWRFTSMPLTEAVSLSRNSPAYWSTIGFGWVSIVLWLSLGRAAPRDRRRSSEPTDDAGGVAAGRDRTCVRRAGVKSSA